MKDARYFLFRQFFLFSLFLPSLIIVMEDTSTHPGHLPLSSQRPHVTRRYTTPGKTSCDIQNQAISRSEFERDYDKIIFSKHFRRLNDKTQVVSLAGDDHTQTRLIHSLEVSCVGRSIAQILLKINVLDPAQKDDIISIVLTACLAHDIGNPPFGHDGERAMCQWWRNFSVKMSPIVPQLDIPDFVHFDGNAMGFAILTEMGVTYSTLLAYTKYPTCAREINQQLPHQHKNGYLEHDAGHFHDAWSQARGEKDLTFGVSRHPLAYIVEAADDICNFVMDVEDCYRHRMMDEKNYRATMNLLLLNMAGEAIPKISEQGKSDEYLCMLTLYTSAVRQNIKPGDSVQSVRYLVTHLATLFAALRFCQYRDAIFSGTFSEPLIKDVLFPPAYKKVFYDNPKTVGIKLQGMEAIDFLMDKFVMAALWVHRNRNKTDTGILGQQSLQHPKIYLLLSDTARAALDDFFSVERSSFEWMRECVLVVAFYVFGMTDGYALKTAQSLKL